MNVLKQLLRWCLHLLTFVSNEGSWRLLEHEKSILCGAVNSLDENAKRYLKSRLNSNFFMERIGGNGRIVIFRFYSENRNHQLVDAKYMDMLVRVNVEVDGEKQRAHVTFYKGEIFSIELSKPSSFYKGRKVIVVNTSMGKASETYTGSIDQEEHD